ncbi:MAG: glycoside hydrolase family 25 protein [Oscillospiraceae bacterium]|nr:glycoside hydrolase family 25 protein [Oscillospiraceae bacterium]
MSELNEEKTVVEETVNTEEKIYEEKLLKTRKMLKLPLNLAVGFALTSIAIIICLSIAVALLAVKAPKQPETEPEAKFIPVINNRVYDFFDEDDTILLNDSYYGDIWLQAFTDLPRHSYDYSGLKFQNGRYTYSENGKQISKTGIDVSYHQGEIDWQRVAADEIDFVILRVGYRGYETGEINLDDRFHTYANGALDAGLEVGVYFYSQAVTTEEAIEEANFVMEQIQRYDITFPIVYDWEITEAENARTNEIAPYTVTECAAAFCDTIADGGYIPMVYGSLKFALFKLDMSKLKDYGFWYAEYKHGYNEPMYPYDFKIWQYASDGRVDGVNGDVDLNICFDTYYGETNADFT